MNATNYFTVRVLGRREEEEGGGRWTTENRSLAFNDSSPWDILEEWETSSVPEYYHTLEHRFDIPNFDTDAYTDILLEVSTNASYPLSVYFSAHELSSLARYEVIIASVILIILYILIIFEWVHRTIAAMVCALLSLATVSVLHERPTFATVVSLIDYETVGLLFGMMIMVGIVGPTGVFEWSAVRAYKYSKGNLWVLTLILCTFTALVSALLDNVTTILLVVPVTINLCRVLDVPPKLLLIYEVLFSNIGGAATIIGDPPNIIIGNNPHIKEVVNFASFSIHVLPGIVLAMIPVYFIMWRVFSKEFKREPHTTLKMDIEIWKHSLAKFRRVTQDNTDYSDDEEMAALQQSLSHHISKLEYKLLNPHLDTLPELEAKYKIKDYPLLIHSSIVLSVVIFLFFAHSLFHIELSLAWISILGAMLLIVVSGTHNLEEVLEKVEFGTLMFFSALFILMEMVTELGLIDWIADQMIAIISSVEAGNGRLVVAVLLLLWVSGIASAFIDNIPYTATLVPVIVKLANSSLGLPLTVLVWALVFGVCLGGNGTLIGASANVVAVGMSEKAGVPISFYEFMKIGFPIMVVTLIVTTIYMLLFQVLLVW